MLHAPAAGTTLKPLETLYTPLSNLALHTVILTTVCWGKNFEDVICGIQALAVSIQ